MNHHGWHLGVPSQVWKVRENGTVWIHICVHTYIHVCMYRLCKSLAMIFIGCFIQFIATTTHCFGLYMCVCAHSLAKACLLIPHHIYTHKHTYMHIHTHNAAAVTTTLLCIVHVHACICICVCTYICIYIYMHIHIYAHTPNQNMVV